MGSNQKSHHETVMEYRGYSIRLTAKQPALPHTVDKWLVSAEIFDPANPALVFYAYEAEAPTDLVGDRYSAVRERVIGMECVIDLGNLPPLAADSSTA